MPLKVKKTIDLA